MASALFRPMPCFGGVDGDNTSAVPPPRWLAFLVFRLGLFPYWLLHFNQDLQEAGDVSFSCDTPIRAVVGWWVHPKTNAT